MQSIEQNKNKADVSVREGNSLDATMVFPQFIGTAEVVPSHADAAAESLSEASHNGDSTHENGNQEQHVSANTFST